MYCFVLCYRVIQIIATSIFQHDRIHVHLTDNEKGSNHVHENYHLSVFNILTFRVLYILQLVNACFKLIKLQHYFHSHFKARLDAFRHI